MRHAHALLPVVVLVSLVGCATAQKREEKRDAAQGKSGSPAPGAQGLCGALPIAVPGGIADAEGAILLLQVEDGIESVDLATGATLWRNPTVDRPIAVRQGRVAAATRVEDSSTDVRLALLEAGTGALISMGPQLSLGAPDSVLRGAFCSAQELDLVWSGRHASGTARVDLVQRTVLAGPHPGQASAFGAPATARLQQLELRAEDRFLRAYADDGSLRWERPLGTHGPDKPHRVSARR